MTKFLIRYDYIPDAFDGVIEAPILIERERQGIRNAVAIIIVKDNGKVELTIEGEAE